MLLLWLRSAGIVTVDHAVTFFSINVKERRSVQMHLLLRLRLCIQG